MVDDLSFWDQIYQGQWGVLDLITTPYTIQYRFPRTKNRRIRQKWSKNLKNRRSQTIKEGATTIRVLRHLDMFALLKLAQQKNNGLNNPSQSHFNRHLDKLGDAD